MTTCRITYLNNKWRIVGETLVAETADKLERRLASLEELGLYILTRRYGDEGQGELKFESA